MANKIKYGLKNVHYAIATINAADNTATYGDPVAIPGAVNLSLDPQGENTPFYADNIVYYLTLANNGYEGDLEIAYIPESFAKDVLGDIEDAKHVLVENANATPVHFALLFQFEGDAKATKHVIYNCVAARPNVEGATKEDTVTPQTETLSLTATPIYSSALSHEIVKARTGDTTDTTTYEDWFESVYQPTAPTNQPAQPSNP